MPTNLELAVFDLAGTTVNDPDAVSGSLRGVLASAGVQVSQAEVNPVMGLPKPDALRKLLEQKERREPTGERSAALHADFVRRMIDFYAADPAVHEIAGTSDTFGKLHQAGIKTAVDTGFSRNIAQVILDRLHWERDGLLDASITSDEAPRGRPHPDMIQRLMQRLGIGDPRRVAKIGDTPADLLQGTSAGCGLVIGVTQGTHTREQLLAYPHTHLIRSVAELPSLLGI